MEFRLLTFEGSGDFSRLWDGFVLDHEQACLGHLRANFHLAAAMGVPNRSLLVLDAKDRVQAALPLFELRACQLGCFPVCQVSSGVQFPAHPLLAPALSERQRELTLAFLLSSAERIAGSCRADSIRIAYPAVIGPETALAKFHYCPLRHYSFADAHLVAWLLDLRLEVEQLSAGLAKSCRNAVARARRGGCRIRPVSGRHEWMDCYDLARQTLGALVDPVVVHAACWDHFMEPGYGRTYAVTCAEDSPPVSIAVTVGWRGNWHYWKNFSARAACPPGANNLAVWEAIVDTKQRGGLFFELGSMEFDDPKQQAISDFKRSFGGTPTYCLRGVRIRRPHRHAVLQMLSALYRSVRGRATRRGR